MGSGRIERNERSKRLAIVPSLVISDHSAVSIYFLFFSVFYFSFKLAAPMIFILDETKEEREKIGEVCSVIGIYLTRSDWKLIAI